MPSRPAPKSPQECPYHWEHKNYSSCQHFSSTQFWKDEEFSYFYRGTNSDIVRYAVVVEFRMLNKAKILNLSYFHGFSMTMSTPKPPKTVRLSLLNLRLEVSMQPIHRWFRLQSRRYDQLTKRCSNICGSAPCTLDLYCTFV